MKPNLIFLHLPKNGGTTIHSILNRWYKRDYSFSIDVIDHVRLNTDEFINLPEAEKKKLMLLKGHMQFGLHTYLDDSFTYITFLRNPVDRIVSYYYYVKRRPNHRLYSKINQGRISLDKFIENETDGDIHNAQVRWISGIDDSPALMLEKAIENIRNKFSFIGIVERFDESVLLLQHLYGFSLPYYIPLNTTNRPKLSVLDNQELYTRILELNRADEKLYKIMSANLDKEIENVPNLSVMRWKLKLANRLYQSYNSSIKPIIKKIS